MHLFKTIITIALSSTAYAQSKTLYFTNPPSSVEVGHPVSIAYVAPDTSQPVKIILRKGAKSHLTTIATLTDSATGGTYSWTPSTSLESGSDYALEITQGDQINYTGQFTVTGGSSTSTSSGSSSTVSNGSTTKLVIPTSIANPNMTASTATTAASAAGTIPISRNGTFVTPSVAPTGIPGGSGGGTGGQGSTNSAANALKGSLPFMIGAAIAVIRLW